MFTSRASCTEPWRQILVCSAIHAAVAFFSLPVIRKKEGKKDGKATSLLYAISHA